MVPCWLWENYCSVARCYNDDALYIPVSRCRMFAFLDKLSSTIVEWQLFWSRQVGAGDLLFWGEENKEISNFQLFLIIIFKPSEIFIIQTLPLGLMLQCSLFSLFNMVLRSNRLVLQSTKIHFMPCFTEPWAFGPHKFLRRGQ